MSTKNTAKKDKVAAQSGISGRVDRIGAGARFEFDVASKKAGRCAFVIANADASSFAAMTSLVTSAYIAGKKVFVQGAPNGEGLLVAKEISIGAKAKPEKAKEKKPAKRLKASPAAPSAEAVPAAA